MRGILAADLQPADVLEFQGIDGSGFIDGIPVERVKRLSRGRVQVIVILAGVQRVRTFKPGETVYLKDGAA